LGKSCWGTAKNRLNLPVEYLTFYSGQIWESIMEVIKQIVRIPKNRKVSIKIPLSVPENELVEIILIIRKKTEDFDRKIDELKAAMNDKLFLDDLKEVAEEFEAIDTEGWEE